MLFLFCWILVPRSTLIDHTLLLNRLHSEICLDSTVLIWFSSYLFCRSKQVLVRHLCQRRLLLSVESRRDQCSVPFSFLSTQDSWRNSMKSSASITTCLPTERESAMRAIGNVESCFHEIKRWIIKTNRSLMSRTLRYFSADRLPGGKVSLLAAFWLTKHPFYSPVL